MSEVQGEQQAPKENLDFENVEMKMPEENFLGKTPEKKSGSSISKLNIILGIILILMLGALAVLWFNPSILNSLNFLPAEESETATTTPNQTNTKQPTVESLYGDEVYAPEIILGPYVPETSSSTASSTSTGNASSTVTASSTVIITSTTTASSSEGN